MSESLPFSPAADRNKAPILAALETRLPARARVLEIASGTGQHAEHFARAHPLWQWQPSDGDAGSVAAIARRCAPLANVAPAHHFDLLGDDPPFALEGFDLVYCANLLHISPWPVCAALMRIAARALTPGGLLAVYGPFEIEGEPLAPSNRAFDADLRSRDARWGLRRLGEVQREAQSAGLQFLERCNLPANNCLVLWRRPTA